MKPEHMMNKQLLVLGAVFVIALGLAACKGGNQESLTFDLSVVGGELGGESDTFVAKQGDDVTLNVSADIAGVFHLHGYDLRARVDANGSGTISFEADATGSFVIALHPSEVGDGSGHQASGGDHSDGGGDITIATLEVRPR